MYSHFSLDSRAHVLGKGEGEYFVYSMFATDLCTTDATVRLSAMPTRRTRPSLAPPLTSCSVAVVPLNAVAVVDHLDQGSGPEILIHNHLDVAVASSMLQLCPTPQAHPSHPAPLRNFSSHPYLSLTQHPSNVIVERRCPYQEREH